MKNSSLKNSSLSYSPLSYSHTKNGDNRIWSIDTLRGFCIILMVLCHIDYVANSQFDFYAHAFHMPVFFIVSGYFFKQHKIDHFLSFLKKKAFSLLIPYLFAFIVHYPLWIIVNKNTEDDILAPLKSFLTFNHDGLPITQAIWFLTALFFAEIIYFFVSLISNRYVRSTVAFAIFLVGIIATKITSYIMPLSISQAFVGVGLLEAGYLFNNCKNKCVSYLKNLNLPATLILFVVNVLMIFCNAKINMRIMRYGYISLFLISSILSFIVLLSLSRHIDKCKNKLCVSVINEIKYIGINSIVYLVFNQICIVALREFLILIKLTDKIPLYISEILFVIISFAFTMLCLRVAAIIFDKTPLRVFMGRKIHDTKI